MKVMAVASHGGHFVQLLRLTPVLERYDLTFLSTSRAIKSVNGWHCDFVVDANKSEKLKTILMFIQVYWIMFRRRPDVVITTGAAVGFAAVFFGRLFRCKTIWIDSVANAEELSASGQMARRWSTHWLTQWEHLANERGPTYLGNVL